MVNVEKRELDDDEEVIEVVDIKEDQETAYIIDEADEATVMAQQPRHDIITISSDEEQGDDEEEEEEEDAPRYKRVRFQEASAGNNDFR